MFGVRCECRDRGECRGAIGSCACVARHALNSSINNPGLATVRHRLPDLGDWCSPRMSALPPKADKQEKARLVRLVSKAAKRSAAKNLSPIGASASLKCDRRKARPTP